MITLLGCVLASVTWATEPDDAAIFSPDKKWVYRLVDGEAAVVRAESGEVVLKLGDEGNSLAAQTRKVLWAPDSRRLAANYRAGGRYYTCAVYEMAGDKWKELPDLESKATSVSKLLESTEARERKRLGVAKSAYRRRIMDEWTVRRWIDQDTFEALALSRGTVVVNKESDEIESIGGTVLFTVKCDNRGGWKVVRLRALSDAEHEKLTKDD